MVQRKRREWASVTFTKDLGVLQDPSKCQEWGAIQIPGRTSLQRTGFQCCSVWLCLTEDTWSTPDQIGWADSIHFEPS